MNRFLREKAVFERVLICPRCAGTFCAAMHPAPALSGDRRRAAGRPRTGFGTAAGTGHHGFNIAPMSAGSLDHLSAFFGL